MDPPEVRRARAALASYQERAEAEFYALDDWDRLRSAERGLAILVDTLERFEEPRSDDKADALLTYMCLSQAASRLTQLDQYDGYRARAEAAREALIMSAAYRAWGQQLYLQSIPEMPKHAIALAAAVPHHLKTLKRLRLTVPWANYTNLKVQIVRRCENLDKALESFPNYGGVDMVRNVKGYDELKIQEPKLIAAVCSTPEFREHFLAMKGGQGSAEEFLLTLQ